MAIGLVRLFISFDLFFDLVETFRRFIYFKFPFSTSNGKRVDTAKGID